MKELTLSDLEAIEGDARSVIDAFIMAVDGDGYQKVYDDRAKNFFKVMATTPIVNNAFDPKNEAIFLSNVATLMKSDAFYKLESVLQTWHSDILMNSSWTDCIDKNAISSVIDLFASVRTCDVAVRVVELTFNLLCKRTGEWIGDQGDLQVVTEDDERFAAAINSGMISACLTMLQRFVGRREYPELLDRVHNLFDSVKRAARKKRSARAIDSNSGIITEALQTSEKSLTGCKESASILRLVKSTLFIIDYCVQCAKVLEKKDVRRCSRCMVVKYCSKECQVEHWRNGSHKAFCNLAAAKAKETKSNGGTDKDVCRDCRDGTILYIQMTATEIARENSGAILFQAISKGYDILDCIVDIDLRVSPPSPEVMLSADFLSADPNEDSESLRLKKIQIDEAREKKKCLPFNYIGQGEGIMAGMVDFHEAPGSAAFPGTVSLFGKTWPEAQSNLKRILSKILSGDFKKAESIPGFVDKLEQILAKSYLRKMEGEDLEDEE